MENAIQATLPKGEVRISAAVHGREVEVSIDDTGPGVEASIRNRLFEPLMTSRPKGIGLGLALVKRILERHGGSIAYRPGSSGGARFVVRLPVASA
jgi:signal transduction histidine kinase